MNGVQEGPLLDMTALLRLPDFGYFLIVDRLRSIFTILGEIQLAWIRWGS